MDYINGIPGVDVNDPNLLQKILDIIGSKGGQTVTSAVGAALQSYGAGKQADADRAATANQFAANMAEREYENDQADQRARSTAALDASPLGQDQNFAQKQAITRAILGNTRNVQLTPGDPRVAAAMGTSTGGVRLPEGGFDPAMLDRLFGDQATQASIAQHAKAIGRVDPGAPAPPLAQLFPSQGESQPNPYLADVAGANAGVQSALDESSQRRRDIIQRAIDEDIKGEKQQKTKGGSKVGKLANTGLSAGTGALTGAGIGTTIFPGIGTGLGAGIGALVGGLKGLFS